MPRCPVCSPHAAVPAPSGPDSPGHTQLPASPPPDNAQGRRQRRAPETTGSFLLLFLSNDISPNITCGGSWGGGLFEPRTSCLQLFGVQTGGRQGTFRHTGKSHSHTATGPMTENRLAGHTAHCGGVKKQLPSRLLSSSSWANSQINRDRLMAETCPKSIIQMSIWGHRETLPILTCRPGAQGAQLPGRQPRAKCPADAHSAPRDPWPGERTGPCWTLPVRPVHAEVTCRGPS